MKSTNDGERRPATRDGENRGQSTFRRRRLIRPIERRQRDFLYYQVHYQPVPGARKAHLLAIQPKLTERIHDMVRRGQLLLCGTYPTSLGGMWLLRVRSHAEAERLVLENPAVSCNLVRHRLLELMDPTGIAVQQERTLTNEQPLVFADRAQDSGTTEKASS
jgi:hypothetical protein